MLCFYFPFPVQFSVNILKNILKKLTIQSSSIMQLVKTAAEILQSIPNSEMKRCKRSTSKWKRCSLKCLIACLCGVKKWFRDKCTVVFTDCLYVNTVAIHKSRKDCGQITQKQGTWCQCFENYVSMDDLLIEQH